MENLPMPRGYKPQIDWRLASQLLAEGRSTAEVATVLRCSRQHIWRILRRSTALRARTSELRRRQASEGAARLQGLRDMAIDTIHQAIADGDKRVACWLADRLGFFNAPPQELVAEVAAAGADQLESEVILDAANAALSVEDAVRTVDAAERDICVASDAKEVTCVSDQGDKEVTVASGNTLSRSAALATRNAVYPPPGVYADD